MFGLKERDIVDIRAVLKGFPEVERALIFGSRAKGSYRQGSDVDMALIGADFHTALKISGILNEETLMPYRFDVLSYSDLKNKDLREHIDRVGKPVYEATSDSLVGEPSVKYGKNNGETS